MKKTALSIFLVLVMCMGLVLPVFAGGEEILSPYMEIEDGMAHQLPLDENASGKGWSYDASTYTLTLNGFEGQYVRVYYAEKPFTMVLADGSSNHFSFGFDVKTNAGFTIKGNGSLDMSGNEFGRFDIGDTLTIESGTIISILKAFLNGGKLHMAGGSLNISGDYYGILGATYDYTGTCTITGGKITIEGTNSALELLRDITAGDMVTGLENAVFTGKDGSALTLQVTDEGASHFARLYDAGGEAPLQYSRTREI